MPISAQYFIEQIKEKYPDLANKYKDNDAMLYSIGRKMHPDAPVLSYSDSTKLASDVERKHRVNHGNSPKANTDPGFFSSLLSYGVDDDSPYFMRQAYNNSLAGLSEQLYEGNPRFNLEEYDMSVLEEAGSMIMSFAYPADLLALALGGGVGRVLATGAKGMKAGSAAARVSSLAGNGLSKRLATQLTKTGAVKHTTANSISKHFLTTYGQLATYEGLKGGISNTIQGESFVKGVAGGMGHAGLMAAAIGIPGGFLAHKNSQLLSKATRLSDVAHREGAQLAKGVLRKAPQVDTKLLSAAERKALQSSGLAGQIGAEVTSFTLLTQAERFMHGDDITLKSFARDLMVNSAFVGVMKSTGKVFGEVKKEVDRIQFEYQKDKALKIIKNAEEVQKGLDESKVKGEKLSKEDIEINKKIDEVKLSLEESTQKASLDTKEKQKDFDALMKQVNELKDLYEGKKGLNIDDISNRKQLELIEETIPKHLDVLNALMGIGTEGGLSKKFVNKVSRNLKEISDFVKDKINSRKKTKEEIKLDLKSEWAKIVKDYGDTPGANLFADKIKVIRDGKEKTISVDEATVKELENSIKPFRDTVDRGSSLLHETDHKVQKLARLERDKTKKGKEEFEKYKEENSSMYKFMSEVKKKFTSFFRNKDKDLTTGGKTDIHNLLAELISNKSIKKSHATKFLEFLEDSKINNLNKIGKKQVIDYIKKLADKGIVTTEHGIAINEIMQQAFRYKTINQMAWTPGDIKPIWTISNRAIKLRSEKRSKVFADFRLKVGKKALSYMDTIKAWVKKKFGENWNEVQYNKNWDNTKKQQFFVTKLYAEEGMGIRTAELNALTPKDIGVFTYKGENIYYVDVASGTKGQGTNARIVILGKKFGENLKQHIKDNKIKQNDNIFKKTITVDTNKNILSMAGETWGKSSFLRKLGGGAKKDIGLSDLRRFIQEGMWNTEIGVERINYILGHGKNISDFYGGRTPGLQKQIFMALEIRRKMGFVDGYKAVATGKEFVGIKDPIAQQRARLSGERMIKPESTEYRVLMDWFKETYPEWYKKFKLESKEKLSEGSQEIVWGDIVNDAIRIARGEIPIDVIPHEPGHAVINILKAAGDKQSKMLIDEGIKIFKSEERLVQALGEYASKKILGKKDISKMGALKNWVKNFWSYMKTKLFGKKFVTEKDITNLLGEQLVTRKAKVLREAKPGMYQADMVRQLRASKEGRTRLKQSVRIAEKDFKEEYKAKFKNLDKEGINKLDKALDEYKNELRERHLGLKEGESLTKADSDALGIYRQELFKLTEKKIESSNPDFVKHELNLKEVSLARGLTNAQLKSILEIAGVKDGNFLNIKSVEAIKDAIALVKENFDKVKRIETPTNLVHKLHKMQKKLPNMFSRFFMPYYYILKHYGGEPGRKLSQKILEFDIHEASLKGRGDMHIKRIKELVGKDTNRLNSLRFIDSEFRKRATKEEIKYIKELDDAGIVFIDGNPVQWVEGMRVPHGAEFSGGSALWRASMEFRKMTDFYWNTLVREVKSNSSSGEFEQFLEQFNKKYITNYFTRIVNPKVLKSLHNHGETMPFMNKIIENSLKNYGEKLAKRRGYKKGSVAHKKFIEEIVKDQTRRDEVKYEIYNMLVNHTSKINSKYLKKRNDFIGDENGMIEVITSNGNKKKVKAYVENFNDISSMYSQALSKYITVQKYFPEFTGLSGKYKVGSAKSKLVDMISKNSDVGGYAMLGLKRHLGIETNDARYLNRKFYSAAGAFSTGTAAIGLSSPTSGIKNLAIGIPRAFGTYGMFNTFKGIAAAFDSKQWDIARREGYLQVGSKGLDLSSKRISSENPILRKFSMENLFKWNLMEKTEGVNRIASAVAGKLYFQQMLRAHKGQSNSLSKLGKSKTERAMREIWELGDKEIAFINKHKLEDLLSPKFENEMAWIEQKVAHMSHASSQGATTTAMLPLWMSGELAKPLTLFMRMAQATTFDTYKNYIKPVKESGNIMPLARFAVTSLASGQMLWAMYDHLFGMENPQSMSDDKFNKMLTYLWKAEFLGTLGEIINPYTSPLYGTKETRVFNGDMSTINPIAEPIVFRNAMLGINEFYGWLSGEKFTGQAIHDLTRKSVVVYGQIDKFRKVHTKKGKKFYENHRRLKTLSMTYKNEMGMSIPSIEVSSPRQPYYRDMKEMFFFGNEKDKAKAFWKAYAYICTDLEQQGYSDPLYRHKNAIKTLKQVVENLNPIPFSKNVKGRQFSKHKEFLDWLKPDMREKALNMEKEFWYKHREFYKIIANSKYRDKYSIYHNLFK